MVRLARKAEASGFESLWVAETRITRDAVVPMAAIAAATERVRLGSAILNVYTRNPVVIAITFVGLDELAPGRIVMGLGTGSPLVLAPQGQPFARPLTRLREYVEVLRPLMRGETVELRRAGRSASRARASRTCSQGRAIASARDADAALPRASPARASLELAGEVADGVLLNVCLPTAYVTRARGLIEQGAQRAGRMSPAIEIGMMLVVSPDEDSRAARTARAASSPSTSRCSRTSPARPGSRRSGSSAPGARSTRAGVAAAARARRRHPGRLAHRRRHARPNAGRASTSTGAPASTCPCSSRSMARSTRPSSCSAPRPA